jgi:hypothetical protein
MVPVTALGVSTASAGELPKAKQDRRAIARRPVASLHCAGRQIAITALPVVGDSFFSSHNRHYRQERWFSPSQNRSERRGEMSEKSRKKRLFAARLPRRERFGFPPRIQPGKIGEAVRMDTATNPSETSLTFSVCYGPVSGRLSR